MQIWLNILPTWCRPYFPQVYTRRGKGLHTPGDFCFIPPGVIASYPQGFLLDAPRGVNQALPEEPAYATTEHHPISANQSITAKDKSCSFDVVDIFVFAALPNIWYNGRHAGTRGKYEKGKRQKKPNGKSQNLKVLPLKAGIWYTIQPLRRRIGATAGHERG